MKIADGELRHLLLHDLKLSADTVRELAADSKQTKRGLLATVLASNLVTDVQIARAYAKRLGSPFVDLQNMPVDPKIIRKIPKAIAIRHHVICFDETPTSIKIAMADPRDEAAKTAIKHYRGKTIRRYLATEKGLTSAMRAYAAADTTPLPLSTNELMMTILEQALRNGSHDIHFEAQGKELLIKRRVGKGLKIMARLPISRARGLVAWCKLRAGNDVGDSERAHHGKFRLLIDGSRHDILINTLPTVDGEKLVLRVVPPSNSVPGLTQIGYASADVKELQQIITDGRGLVIIAGGNGEEVPTTLASLTRETAAQPHSNVVSLEDPRKFQITGAAQVEVTDSLPFDAALEAATAQNPSTLITSHLGNGKTAEQLVDYALANHLVISGLYATSILAVLKRLSSLPIAPALAPASLRLIIVQRHIPKLCNRCRISFKPTGPLKQALMKQFNLDADLQLYRQTKGCDDCQGGTNGTVLSYEWLPVTPELQQLLATGADQQTLAQYVQNNSGYAAQLGKLAHKGLISIDEATQLAA